MKNIYTIDNNTIVINGKNVDFSNTIGEVVDFNDIIIVRLIVPSGSKFNKNVFALTRDGCVLWQICESPHGGDINKPFMKISISSSGELIAENWIGVNYKVDLNSGSLIVESFKR